MEKMVFEILGLLVVIIIIYFILKEVIVETNFKID